MNMMYTTEQKVNAVYRITVLGHRVGDVQAELGCSRATLLNWRKSKTIRGLVDKVRAQAPAAAPPEQQMYNVDNSRPILGDLQKPRLMEALRDGLPLHMALPLVRLSPRAGDYWQERADAGDEECRLLMLDFAQVGAEFDHRMMQQATGVDRGARNAQWALRCKYRDYFGEHGPEKAVERSPLEAYTDEQLDAVISAEG